MKNAELKWEVRGARGGTDAGEPVFWPGDTVTGRVEFCPAQDLGCRGIDLKLCCQTGGRCTPEQLTLQTKRIWDGPVVAGQRVEYSFALPLPSEGPVSYSGKLFHLTWGLILRVDIPLWKDPKENYPLTVRPRYSP